VYATERFVSPRTVDPAAGSGKLAWLKFRGQGVIVPQNLFSATRDESLKCRRLPASMTGAAVLLEA
jgi:hypothetical protein